MLRTERGNGRVQPPKYFQQIGECPDDASSLSSSSILGQHAMRPRIHQRNINSDTPQDSSILSDNIATSYSMYVPRIMSILFLIFKFDLTKKNNIGKEIKN